MIASRGADAREEKYPFESLLDLIRHYGDSLPMSRIDATIRDAAIFFVCRISATPNQERLQFLKRCSDALEADKLLLQEILAQEMSSGKKRPKG